MRRVGNLGRPGRALALALALALAAGCADEPPPAGPALPVWLESRKVDAGVPAVLHAPAGADFAVPEGLTATQVAETDDGVATWEILGEPGSYHLEVPVPGGEPVQVFFDVGVEGPTGGPMEDVTRPPPPPPPLWPRVLAAVAGGAAVLALGAWAWRRFKPVPPPPPPEPADRVARREWAAVRARTDIPPEALALELSAVYRRYLDATHTWPATARTTREILDNLAGEMTALDLDRARRLLGAMDLVKFSERGAHGVLFESFDQDFDALVRPVRAPVEAPVA